MICRCKLFVFVILFDHDVFVAEHFFKLVYKRFVYHALCTDALFLLLAVDYHLLRAGEHGQNKLDALQGGVVFAF